MASGDVALAAGILIGSTIVTGSFAGPILALETSSTSVHPGHILFTLLIVVAAPLAVGILVRSFNDITERGDAIAASASTLSVAALVALVASEVHLSTKYLSVFAAIVLFLILSAIVGRLMGLGNNQSVIKAFLLTTSMRDFAIAAALATAAFGSTAAAALGIYGITVLIWGTGCAGLMRRRHPR
jgi:predicted Na+-dependent transporter